MNLDVLIPGIEFFDDETETFSSEEPKLVTLNHCLLSVSKWESINHKSFLSTPNLSTDELVSYILCMDLTGSLTRNEVARLSNDQVKEINDLISTSYTATHIQDPPGRPPNREKITSELIYYWMFSFGIPKECEEWHLSRLLALIKVFSVKTNPPKGANTPAATADRHALNARRRAMMHSKG